MLNISGKMNSQTKLGIPEAQVGMLRTGLGVRVWGASKVVIRLLKTNYRGLYLLASCNLGSACLALNPP